MLPLDPLTETAGAPRDWRDRRAIRFTVTPFQVAVLVSILLHAVVLWDLLPHLKIKLPAPDDAVLGRLNVVLAPPPRPPSSPPSPPPSPPEAEVQPPPPPPKPRPHKAVPRPPPAPPVLAAKKASPEVPAPAPPAPQSTPRPPVTGDLASYIEARRRSRGDPGQSSVPTEDSTARANRMLAADIAAEQQARKAKEDPNQGGGIFQIRRIGYEDAEFLFFGWSKEAQRRQSQMIEVRRGSYPSIRVAIVRRMIEIIRDHEQGDFLWESQRLGRHVTLSARPGDDAGLQSFLMQEFFPGAQPAR